MAELNSGHKNFNEEEFPIPIPPVDQAWQSMQQKLDVELPVERNASTRTPIRHIWIKTTVIIATVAAITTILGIYSRRVGKISPSNNVHDTTAFSIYPARPADGLTVTDTVRRSSVSSIITGISGEEHDTVLNDLSTSSSPSRSLSLLSQPSASVKSSAPLQSSAADKKYTVRKNTGHSPVRQQTINQQRSQSPVSGKQYARATTDQLITDKQSLQPPTSDKQDHADKTTSRPFAAKQTTGRQQLPVKLNAHTGDHSGEETANHPLQLAIIQTPLVKSNTSLQHQADLLTLRPTSNRDREKNWAVYIQLNIPLPLYGDSLYVVGPNGKDQFYRSLIPALRIERRLWKGTLSLDVQPSLSVALKYDSPKKDSGIQWNPLDTAQLILKQYGWGLTFQYQFHIHDKWQLGGGIQTSFLQKAVIRKSTSDTLGRVTSNIYPASTADKQDFSKMRINGMAELNYVTGKWQLGLRTLVPITRVSKSRDISARPVNVEFIFRRKLWTK